MVRKNQRLSVYGLGLAIGIVCGVTLVILAWLAAAYGYAGPVVIYLGYANFL
ncbi:putative membrane protein [Piscirickettsia salmonis]|uniref:Uncharacterized protein n=1 Tax=Piscirickettsia salmonis TaxID=1238 RepID=A0A9Q6PTG1_PISSA|nr:putative membrane protein [Piscirickettsia salmonis]ALA24557.1 membrane protein [Piscirickettsia salmonis]ERL62845.1 putative membrane protein [Piscirickettsia salmonis LF-89 = ATCC VR-1361]QGN77792.1 hypothetical protein Psal001_02011 [Piscirickettsia salmonis]QGN81380.1 hypothetical protein Psal002_02034 [Piscirickettsia salmonis]QGN84348.1 hypothetical protein Psal003_01398 [Piscirickettsia salmonis]